jgi:4-hydroxybenzoate polyprenyltransferase
VLRVLWSLARPKGMALIALLPVIGFSFAYWDHGCTIPGWGAVPYLLLLVAVWAVPHMGTMWLNAALDRDEGQVLFGEAVPVPPGIEKYAYATLLLALAAAFATHLGLGLCVLGCALLSVLYSHPRTAWKGHALLGPLSNAVGYGVLSPLGGWLLAGLPPSPRGLLVLVVSVCFMVTAYLAAQAFQEEEDRARGYRTLVATHGPRLVLGLTRAGLALSVGLTVLGALTGWFPRAVLIALPAFVVADRHLARWRQVPGGGDGRWAAGFFVRLAAAGLLCLAAVSAHYAWSQHAWSQHAWSQHEGGRLGGLATAAGQPSPAACGR